MTSDTPTDGGAVFDFDVTGLDGQHRAILSAVFDDGGESTTSAIADATELDEDAVTSRYPDLTERGLVEYDDASGGADASVTLTDTGDSAIRDDGLLDAIQDISANFRQLRSQVVSINEQLGDSVDEATLSDHIDQLQEDLVSELGGRIDDVETEAASAADRTEDLGDRIDDLEDGMDDLTSTVESAETRLRGAEAALGWTAEERTATSEQLADLDEEIQTLSERTGDLDDSVTRIDDIEQRLDAVDNRLDEAMATDDEPDAFEELEAQIADLQDHLDDVDERMTDLEEGSSDGPPSDALVDSGSGYGAVEPSESDAGDEESDADEDELPDNDTAEAAEGDDWDEADDEWGADDDLGDDETGWDSEDDEDEETPDLSEPPFGPEGFDPGSDDEPARDDARPDESIDSANGRARLVIAVLILVVIVVVAYLLVTQPSALPEWVPRTLPS